MLLAMETVRGRRPAVHDIVRVWRDVIIQFSHRYIVVFDYFSATSVAVLEEPTC